MARIEQRAAWIVAGLLACLAGGCATQSSVRDEPLDRGSTHIFHADYARVLQLTRDSIPEIGLTMKEERPIEHGGTMLIAARGVTWFSWGEIVRTLVQPAGNDGTSVRVLTERAYAGTSTAKMDFDADLFTKVGRKLGAP